MTITCQHLYQYSQISSTIELKLKIEEISKEKKENHSRLTRKLVGYRNWRQRW